MIRTIRLSGELGRRFGKYHRFDVSTPAEAVRALCANFAGFERHLIESERRGVGYRVLASTRPTLAEQLHDATPAEVISICPVFTAGKSALIGILLGVALIASSFFLPGAGGLAATGALASISLSGIAFSLGASLVLGGISQMLSKPPKLKNVDKTGASENYYFNGPINTNQQGGPVPVGYGRLIVGGSVIYAGLFAEERAS